MARLTQPALYAKLQAFHLDPPGSAVSFTRRLADAKGWSHAFADKAVREYLRFVYLATISNSELTPSVPVDEVWHLHLEDAANYSLMCDEVLGKPLHHNAGAGAPGETSRFNQQYRRTLTQYQMEFGTPPGDWWPQKKAGFGQRKRSEPVAFAAAPPPVPAWRRIAGAGFLGLSALGGGGFVYGLVFGIGSLVLMGFVALVLGLLVRALVMPSRVVQGGSSCGGGGCGSSGSDDRSGSDSSGSSDSGSDGGSSCGGGGCGGGGGD